MCTYPMTPTLLDEEDEMDIKAEDCRLEGFGDALESYWLRATHIPTGTVVEMLEGSAAGTAGKRRLMEKLQEAVNATNKRGRHGRS